MDSDYKHEISHRADAFAKLKNAVLQLLKMDSLRSYHKYPAVSQLRNRSFGLYIHWPFCRANVLIVTLTRM